MTLRLLGACCAGVLLWTTAGAVAQPVEKSDDCRIPGGCGTSGKPGGVEHAPGAAMDRSAPAAAPAPMMRAPVKPGAAMPRPPAAAAPPPAAKPVPGTAVK